jgi:hypothetical protein
MNLPETEQDLIRRIGQLRTEADNMTYWIGRTGDAIWVNRGLLRQQQTRERTQFTIDEQELQLKNQIAARSKVLEQIAAIEVQLQAIWNPSPVVAAVQPSAEPIAVGVTDDPFVSLADGATDDF